MFVLKTIIVLKNGFTNILKIEVTIEVYLRFQNPKSEFEFIYNFKKLGVNKLGKTPYKMG